MATEREILRCAQNDNRRADSSGRSNASALGMTGRLPQTHSRHSNRAPQTHSGHTNRAPQNHSGRIPRAGSDRVGISDRLRWRQFRLAHQTMNGCAFGAFFWTPGGEELCSKAVVRGRQGLWPRPGGEAIPVPRCWLPSTRPNRRRREPAASGAAGVWHRGLSCAGEWIAALPQHTRPRR